MYHSFAKKNYNFRLFAIHYFDQSIIKIFDVRWFFCWEFILLALASAVFFYEHLLR